MGDWGRWAGGKGLKKGRQRRKGGSKGIAKVKTSLRVVGYHLNGLFQVSSPSFRGFRELSGRRRNYYQCESGKREAGSGKQEYYFTRAILVRKRTLE